MSKGNPSCAWLTSSAGRIRHLRGCQYGFLRNNAAHLLGVNEGQALGLFRYVCREGYVGLSYDSDLSKSFNYVTVDYIKPPGLLEIGELPTRSSGS